MSLTRPCHVSRRSFRSQSKQRPFVLVGCGGYQQRSAWDLVQLRVRLGQWRKYLTAVTVRSGVVPRSALSSSSACDVSPPTTNPERWSIFPESSVGRERLVKLSHNTADDLNVASPLWGCGLPTYCCLRDHVGYSAARLPECLRCLVMMPLLCHFAYYALASSITSPGTFLSG